MCVCVKERRKTVMFIQLPRESKLTVRKRPSFDGTVQTGDQKVATLREFRLNSLSISGASSAESYEGKGRVIPGTSSYHLLQRKTAQVVWHT